MNVFTRKVGDTRKVIKVEGIAKRLFLSCFKVMMLIGKSPQKCYYFNVAYF